MELAQGSLPRFKESRQEAHLPRSGRMWAILLAAGEGSRVSALTGQTDGRPVPKQFCTMDGRGSMLRWAINRAAGNSWRNSLSIAKPSMTGMNRSAMTKSTG